MSGLPKVPRHRPAEPRDKPLPGTKTLDIPKDPEFSLKPSAYQPKPNRFERHAWLFGRLAIACALVLLALVWIAPDGGLWPGIGLLALTHVFAIYSQIASSGRDRWGGISIIVLYGGLVLSVLIRAILRALGT